MVASDSVEALRASVTAPLVLDFATRSWGLGETGPRAAAGQRRTTPSTCISSCARAWCASRTAVILWRAVCGLRGYAGDETVKLSDLVAGGACCCARSSTSPRIGARTSSSSSSRARTDRRATACTLAPPAGALAAAGDADREKEHHEGEQQDDPVQHPDARTAPRPALRPARIALDRPVAAGRSPGAPQGPGGR